ncbi:hypothetical protein B0H63DRAFT_406578 [Podospora didyma]|uniref:Uncharacterized protein n=1 Tax=Podospora didyma TaxID=330526 RepID=A0AAE0P4V9_9PEZI|nr:hypothetical protein B0H63DRAFT_406578 [Podospora didyma]
MARTKQKARRTHKPLTTWTRFQMPREQEWPVWSVDHADVHVGPLADVEGWRKVSLGRMVDNPERAAYIIDWVALDDLKNFQSSPACAEFLKNLPADDDDDNVGADDDSTGFQSAGSTALGHLTLDDHSTATTSSSSPSRFLTLKHVTEAATPMVPDDGRVMLTTLLVPQAVAVNNVLGMWRDTFERAFAGFVPRGSEFMAARDSWWFKSSAMWFSLLSEDDWVQRTFGGKKLQQEPEQMQEQMQTEGAEEQGDGVEEGQGQDGGRTLFCHFFLWRPAFGGTPEHEEASAADPQAKESWRQVIARVMPPATAWEQERWDIRRVPRFESPEPELDPEKLQYE